MGDYLNPGTMKFQRSLNSEIYVDKSELISKTNALFNTRQSYICISRPRRFGKTMAMEMLAAYYGYGEDADSLFCDLKIGSDDSYKKHLNQYNCIALNIQEFLSGTNTVEEMLKRVQLYLTRELQSAYPAIDYLDPDNFIQVMKDVFQASKRQFVILLDEWDCLFREYKEDLDSQRKYLDFLRMWLKDQAYVGLAYMTGILPVKKYGTHSALNMFWEYSMIDPLQFVDFFGFTEAEVESLCTEYEMSLEEVSAWYNGYFKEAGSPIYNPTSVAQCLMRKRISNYWNQTETYEALKEYIQIDYFGGLRENIIAMIAGEAIVINTLSFANDMTTFETKDDILTLLVHLGYLSYNFDTKEVRIPNREVQDEFITSVRVLKWNEVVDAINASEEVLKSIWNLEADVVAAGIEKTHEESASILQYNDENALSSVINLTLYSAREYYSIVREFPTGKGFADLVYIPRKKFSDKPAMIVELKWDKKAQGAIEQIENRNYAGALDAYKENLLLVGINYDLKTKKHECVIEKYPRR